MTPIFFAYFALVSIVAGVLTVALRNPVHCGIALLALLGHIAGLFVLLHAEFLAVVQIIIYAGAILILYLFVLMLLNLKTEERYFHNRHAWYMVGVGALTVELLLVLLASRYSGMKGPATTKAVEAVGNRDRKSTRLNSSHSQISYAVFCLKKKKKTTKTSYDSLCGEH